MSKHYLHSSFREKLIEHLVIGELLKLSWIDGRCALEVAVPEVDRSGYDVILEHLGVVRHVQFKASKRDARTPKQNIQVALQAKPSACVVWTFFSEETLELGPFLFFGNEPGRPMPKLDTFPVAKHTKANAQGEKGERSALRSVPRSAFRQLASSIELWGSLFGDVQQAA